MWIFFWTLKEAWWKLKILLNDCRFSLLVQGGHPRNLAATVYYEKATKPNSVGTAISSKICSKRFVYEAAKLCVNQEKKRWVKKRDSLESLNQILNDNTRSSLFINKQLENGAKRIPFVRIQGINQSPVPLAYHSQHNIHPLIQK